MEYTESHDHHVIMLSNQSSRSDHGRTNSFSAFCAKVLQQDGKSTFLSRNRLLVILIGLVVDNVEKPEFVGARGGGDDTKPVTKLLLLEVLLCPATPKG